MCCITAIQIAVNLGFQNKYTLVKAIEKIRHVCTRDCISQNLRSDFSSVLKLQ